MSSSRRSDGYEGPGLDAEGEPGWRAFFDQFSHVVLVGNSHEADIDLLRSRFPDTALFIFFNRVYKVLARPFEGHSLLVSCVTTRGAIIVTAGVVDLVMPLLRPGRFHGVVEMLVDERSRSGTAADYGEERLFTLDVATRERDFYTQGMTPTTGLHFILWLLDLGIRPPVHLYCFTGKPSPNWRMSRAHDWQFEQGVLRYLAAARRIVVEEPDPYRGDPVARIMSRFGETDPAIVAAALVDRHEGEIAALTEATFLAKPLRVRARELWLKLVRALLGKSRSEALYVARKDGETK